MGVTCGRCLLDLCEPPFLLFCVPVFGYACETALPDSLWDSASQQWFQQWLQGEDACCGKPVSEPQCREPSQNRHPGQSHWGRVYSITSLPLLLLGAFSCVGDLRTNEGQAHHVGLTAGEGVALSNVVQSRPAPGTAGLRGPDLLPIPEATGLGPPCSLGRSENL